MAVIRVAILLGTMLAGGCTERASHETPVANVPYGDAGEDAEGDDPQLIRLIESVVAAGNIGSANYKGSVYITRLNLVDEQAIQLLPRLDELKSLITLTLGYKHFKDEDLKALPPLPKLQVLRLGQQGITDAGLEYLAPMEELRRLEINGTSVRGAGFEHLKRLSKLETLSATSTALDDSAMPHIVANFPRLKRIDCNGTNVTAEGVMQLAALPWLTVVGGPNDLFGPRNDPQTKERMREFVNRYLAIYNEAKRKARAEGKDVPPDHVAPFTAF